MIKLAECSGTVIYEAGNKLYISKRPATWTSVFLFVNGLLAFILLGNGLIQLAMFKKQPNGSSAFGIILILVAVFLILIFWRVKLYQKKIGAIPVHELKNIAIFDFESNNLLDMQQKRLTSINKVSLIRKMQLGSSSPELIIRWDSGSISVVKGNPFSGGIAGIEKVLLSKGIRGK